MARKKKGAFGGALFHEVAEEDPLFGGEGFFSGIFRLA
jgi:hypothetical protein